MSPVRELWAMAPLRMPPTTYPAEPELAVPGLTAVYYEGLPYRGRDTRVFAYFGLPAFAAEHPVPAVVCVHGGGGSAYAEWVRTWNARGYAAIAMDLEGHVPVGSESRWQRHGWAGPLRSGVFADYLEPLEDQWTYHAVAAVIRAHSLLASVPGVRAPDIGLVGISWGGVVATVVAGLDARFRFTVPIYGCGWTYEQPNHWGAAFDGMGSHRGEVIARYDPSSYLPHVRMPMLWQTGARDAHFHLSSFSRSYSAASAGHPATVMSVRQETAHSHPDGWSLPEQYVFADSIVAGGEPLLRVGPVVDDGGVARAVIDRPARVEEARLWWTEDTWHSGATTWHSAGAATTAAGTLSAVIPDPAVAWYFEIIDVRGLVVTTAVASRGGEAAP